MGFANFCTFRVDPCVVMMLSALFLTYVVDLRKRWVYVCEGLIFGGQREQFYHYMGGLGNPMYLICIGLVRDVFLRFFYTSVLINIGSNLSFCYQVMHQFAFTLFILIKYL